jgi:hypothetical protein
MDMFGMASNSPEDGRSALTEAAKDEREWWKPVAEIYWLKGELLLKLNESNAAAQSWFQRGVSRKSGVVGARRNP